MTPHGPLVVAARTSLVLVVALTLQLGVASRLEVAGVQGDLMLLIAVAAGFAAGPDRGAVVAFAAGLSFDLLLQSPFGLSSLTYAIVAYIAGSLQESVLRAAWWIPVTTAATASALGVILYGVFGIMVGEEIVGTSLLRIAVIVGILNGVASPPALRVLRWATGVSEGMRSRAMLR